MKNPSPDLFKSSFSISCERRLSDKRTKNWKCTNKFKHLAFTHSQIIIQVVNLLLGISQTGFSFLFLIFFVVVARSETFPQECPPFYFSVCVQLTFSVLINFHANLFIFERTRQSLLKIYPLLLRTTTALARENCIFPALFSGFVKVVRFKLSQLFDIMMKISSETRPTWLLRRRSIKIGTTLELNIPISKTFRAKAQLKKVNPNLEEGAQR